MPISSSFSLPKPERKEFELIKDDTYESVIKDVEDKISFYKNEDGSDKLVLNFTFQITEEGPYKNRLMWKEVAPFAFYGGKGASILLQVCNATNGSDLTEEQAEGIDATQVSDLIGKKLRILVGHITSKNGKVNNKVTGFLSSKTVHAPSSPAPVPAYGPTPDIPFGAVNEKEQGYPDALNG